MDPQEAALLYIDKFGNQTDDCAAGSSIPSRVVKGYPLYKVDDLGPAEDSTPATLHGLQQGLILILADGRNDRDSDRSALSFLQPNEYYDAIDAVVAHCKHWSTFWGKDFLLIDVDAKVGLISIDIPPGTYNGTQLADCR